MAFGAGCLARSRYERDCLVTEEYRIASEKIHGQGKTIVFLTDLHNKEFGEENSRLLETVRKVKPDAVLFGGDGMVAKRGNSQDPAGASDRACEGVSGILRKWKS